METNVLKINKGYYKLECKILEKSINYHVITWQD